MNGSEIREFSRLHATPRGRGTRRTKIETVCHYSWCRPLRNYHANWIQLLCIARDGKHLKLPLTRRRLVPSVFVLWGADRCHPCLNCMAPIYIGREFDLLTRRSNRMSGHQSEPENVQGLWYMHNFEPIDEQLQSLFINRLNDISRLGTEDWGLWQPPI